MRIGDVVTYLDNGGPSGGTPRDKRRPVERQILGIGQRKVLVGEKTDVPAGQGRAWFHPSWVWPRNVIEDGGQRAREFAENEKANP